MFIFVYTTDNKLEYTALVPVCLYTLKTVNNRNRVNTPQSRVANQFISYYIHRLPLPRYYVNLSFRGIFYWIMRKSS